MKTVKTQIIREFIDEVASKSQVCFGFWYGMGINWGAMFVVALSDIARFTLGYSPDGLRYLLPCPQREHPAFFEAIKHTKSSEVLNALNRLKAHHKYEELIANGVLWLPNETLEAIEEALYLKSTTEGLSCEDEVKMFDLPNASEQVWEYIKKYPLCYEGQLRMFDLPNAREVVSEYIKTYDLYPDAQVRMFDLPNAWEVVSEYIKTNPLASKAQVRMFDLENADDAILEYAKTRRLGIFVELKLFELPNVQETLKRYLKYQPLDNEDAQLKILELGNAEEILALWQEKGYYPWMKVRDEWNKKLGKKIF